MTMLENVEIPFRGYWSTPFVKWQGAFAHLHSMKFAAHVAKNELDTRGIAPDLFDHSTLGVTVPQWRSFWGAPWVMSMIGVDNVPGPTVVQACQTGPRAIAFSATEVNEGVALTSLVVTCDRASNGAFITYAGDGGPGGIPQTEAFYIDNFSDAPHLREPVVQTAENCAEKWGIETSEQHDVVMRRYQQYGEALANDRAFQRRYMTLPFGAPDAKLAKVIETIDGDVGVHNPSRDDLDRLKPATPGGTVTFAGQTHPADGNASMIVASSDKAREISADSNIRIRILSYAQGRAERGFMPFAPVPATKTALQRAGLQITDIDAVKSHNPFVVNDIVFARETGFDVMKMNNYGCSLVFGHPQGPTGTRVIIELIEELVARGGGLGLYNGCAAGDSGFAMVIEVSQRPSNERT